MSKQSSYGRAPPRSARSRLFDKGYKEYDLKDGRVNFGNRSEAEAVVKKFHDKGYLAQVAPVRAPWGMSTSYCVMYKEK